MRENPSPSRRSSSRVASAGVKCRPIQQTNLMVDEILVIVVVPEIRSLSFPIICKPSLHPHGQVAVRLPAIVPQAESLGT